MYYLRKNCKGWKGPAVVLGQDGQFVQLRHGGQYLKVHPCQVMKVKSDITRANNSKYVEQKKEEHIEKIEER